MSALPVAPKSWKKPPLVRIDSVVSAYLGETRVKGNRRPAAFNRHVAIYLAHRAFGWSTSAIGRLYNGRHDTTVIAAIQRIEFLLETNTDLGAFLSQLEQAITEETKLRVELDTPSPDIRNKCVSVATLLRIEEALDNIAERVASKLAIRLREAFLAAECTVQECAQDISPNLATTLPSPNR